LVQLVFDGPTAQLKRDWCSSAAWCHYESDIKTCFANYRPSSVGHQSLTGLLMRPEYSETKAKTETRECETETKTSIVKSIACESNTDRYVLFFITHMR